LCNKWQVYIISVDRIYFYITKMESVFIASKWRKIQTFYDYAEVIGYGEMLLQGIIIALFTPIIRIIAKSDLRKIWLGVVKNTSFNETRINIAITSDESAMWICISGPYVFGENLFVEFKIDEGCSILTTLTTEHSERNVTARFCSSPDFYKQIPKHVITMQYHMNRLLDVTFIRHLINSIQTLTIIEYCDQLTYLESFIEKPIPQYNSLMLSTSNNNELHFLITGNVKRSEKMLFHFTWTESKGNFKKCFYSFYTKL